MNEPNGLESLAGYSTGCLCDAHPAVRIVGASVRALLPGIGVIGFARTAAIESGQNAAIHRAVQAAQVGEVLIVSTGGDTGHGYFGDILAQCCKDRGISGLVIDGSIRDSESLADMDFPVYCAGVSPRGTRKSRPGEINVEITCGEARVCPGDLVFGDRDGVVIVPREFTHDIARRARDVMKREEQIRERLERGEPCSEIFGIPV